MRPVEGEGTDRAGGTVDGSSRRRFVKDAGLGGVTLAVGGMLNPFSSLWSPAFALDANDESIMQFAESVELAVVEAYRTVAQTGKVIGTALATLETFAAHHGDHAVALGGMAGDRHKAMPNPTLAQSSGSLITSAANQDALLTIAYGLENAVASTYLVVIATLTQRAALGLTASILPVESQHAVVLGQMLDVSATNDASYLPAFITTGDAVEPSRSPIAPGS